MAAMKCFIISWPLSSHNKFYSPFGLIGLCCLNYLFHIRLFVKFHLDAVYWWLAFYLFYFKFKLMLYSLFSLILFVRSLSNISFLYTFLELLLFFKNLHVILFKKCSKYDMILGKIMLSKIFKNTIYGLLNSFIYLCWTLLIYDWGNLILFPPYQIQNSTQTFLN